MAKNWIQLIFGIWVLLSPWLLGVSGVTVILWSNSIVGLVLILTGIWTIFGAGSPKH